MLGVRPESYKGTTNLCALVLGLPDRAGIERRRRQIDDDKSSARFFPESLPSWTSPGPRDTFCRAWRAFGASVPYDQTKHSHGPPEHHRSSRETVSTALSRVETDLPA
jgi:hypothetical protein